MVGATDDPVVVVVVGAVVVVLAVDSGTSPRSGTGTGPLVAGDGTAVPRTCSALPNATTPTKNTNAALNPAAAHRTRVRSMECW
ncbi:hypothetical protein AADW15_38405 [Saccharothrix sp. CCNWLY140-2]|uniref:hypothetical protein n=1 Tax=unclassified Saccharothrix TaxID=2593673 RepID=UPI00307F6976